MNKSTYRNTHKERKARGLQFVGGYMSEDVVKRIDAIATILDVPRSEAVRYLIMNTTVLPQPKEDVQVPINQ